MGARGGRSWRKPAPHQDRFLFKLHGPRGRKAKRTAVEDRPKSEKNNGACQRAPTTAAQVTTEKKGNSRHRRCTPLRYAEISDPWKRQLPFIIQVGTQGGGYTIIITGFSINILKALTSSAPSAPSIAR
jgi:hypothetical protein